MSTAVWPTLLLGNYVPGKSQKKNILSILAILLHHPLVYFCPGEPLKLLQNNLDYAFIRSRVIYGPEINFAILTLYWWLIKWNIFCCLLIILYSDFGTCQYKGDTWKNKVYLKSYSSIIILIDRSYSMLNCKLPYITREIKTFISLSKQKYQIQ